MKTLYLTRGNNILVDSENNTSNKMPTCRVAIDNVYLVKEPLHVVYGSGEKTAEVDAKEGDIVVTFYHGTFKNQMIVINSAEWAENITLYQEEEQKERERWAAAKQSEISDAVNTAERSDNQ